MWTLHSYRNKFTEIEYILTHNLMDVLFVTETKIDSSFTNAQFHIKDFKLHTDLIETVTVVVFWHIYVPIYPTEGDVIWKIWYVALLNL